MSLKILTPDVVGQGDKVEVRAAGEPNYDCPISLHMVTYPGFMPCVGDYITLTISEKK